MQAAAQTPLGLVAANSKPRHDRYAYENPLAYLSCQAVFHAVQFVLEFANRLLFTFKLDFASASEKIGLALLGTRPTTLGDVPRSISRFSKAAVASVLDWLILQYQVV